MNSSNLERSNYLSNNDEKTAEIVGRTFYRALTKRGFSEKQIICVATNIISYLTDSLRGQEIGKTRKTEAKH